MGGEKKRILFLCLPPSGRKKYIDVILRNVVQDFFFFLPFCYKVAGELLKPCGQLSLRLFWKASGFSHCCEITRVGVNLQSIGQFFKKMILIGRRNLAENSGDIPRRIFFAQEKRNQESPAVVQRFFVFCFLVLNLSSDWIGVSDKLWVRVLPASLGIASKSSEVIFPIYSALGILCCSWSAWWLSLKIFHCQTR